MTWSLSKQETLALPINALALLILVTKRSQVQILVRVRNTSTVAGSSSCFIRGVSPSGTYKGYDNFTGTEVPLLKAIAPGEEVQFYARLNVTGEGAEYATQATAECS